MSTATTDRPTPAEAMGLRLRTMARRHLTEVALVHARDVAADAQLIAHLETALEWAVADEAAAIAAYPNLDDLPQVT